MIELFDYQDEDVTRAIAEGHKSIFLAYEQALGKTITAVEFAKRTGVQTVVVVAPLNTRHSWERTVKDMIPDAEFFYLENTPAAHRRGTFTKLKEQHPGWYFIGWEYMRTGAVGDTYADMVIADEVHRIQNYGKSLTSQAIRWTDSEYKVALSGTPAANRPEGLFSPMNWLWPERYKSYHKWIEKFWRTIRDGAIIKLVRELTPGGVVNDMPFFVRRRKADHRGDLPPVMPPIYLTVPLLPAQRKIYKQWDELALAWIGDSPVAASNSLVNDLRLRQITLGVPSVIDGKVTFAEDAKSPKLDALIALIKDGGDDETWFVLVPSKPFAEVIVPRLNKAGIKSVAFTGSTKKKDRQALVEGLGTDHRVIVATTPTVAEGLDGLQHVCSTGVVMAKHANWMLNVQAGERLDRPGQKDSVQWYYLVSPDTVDEKAELNYQDTTAALTELYDLV
jgi:SNF2 family DNA or RNA helicase